MTLDFIFRLVHCSSEDVSFNSICLNVLEGIKQFYLLMWFKKIRLETTLFCGSFSLFVFRGTRSCRFLAALWSPSGKGLTSLLSVI